MLAETNTRTGINNMVRFIRRRIHKEIPVLAYHRIADIDVNYPFDMALISASKNDFHQQMKYIKKHYTPVDMSSFVRAVEGKEELPDNAIMVTFDDGFDDNYHNAFPILSELNIPATVFITTDFIGSVETIWYERLAYFFASISTDKIILDDINIAVRLDDTLKTAREAYQEVVEKLKLVDNAVRLQVIEKLYQTYGDPYSNIGAGQHRLSLPMSWEQVREMDRDCIDFGSHCVTHPVLSMLPNSQVEYELKESKKIIENQLGHEINSIAYPVGQEESISNDVYEIAKQTGYKLAFSYVDGLESFPVNNRYAITRLHVDADLPRSMFESKLTLPELFCE